MALDMSHDGSQEGLVVIGEHEGSAPSLHSTDDNEPHPTTLLAKLTVSNGKIDSVEPDRRRYRETMRALMAYCTSSAVDLMPRSSIMLYLWNATVLAVMLRMLAISFIVRPSASSWRTSR